jgi:hypothetical protein
MTKQFCDLCGEELEKRSWHKSVKLYDLSNDNTVMRKDLCDSCFNKIYKLIEDLKKKS